MLNRIIRVFQNEHSHYEMFSVLMAIFAILTACDSKQPNADIPTHPQIHIVNNQINVGTVLGRSTKIIDIPVLNTGSEPLIIESIKTSCNCVGADISENEIQPGSEAIIQVRFEGGERYGEDLQSILITSNDPHNQLYTISLIVTYERQVTPFPAFINLGRIIRGEKRSSRFLVQELLPSDWNPQLVTTSSAALRIERNLAGGDSIPLVLASQDKSENEGIHNTSIVFELDSFKS